MSTYAKNARTTARQPHVPADTRAARRARAKLVDRVMTGVLWGVAALLVAVLASFLLYTIIKGIGVLSWKYMTTSSLTGDAIGPELFNTFYIIGLALLISIPIALGAAIYLAEYATQGAFTTIVRFATETLAGIPSIVLGLFGFLVFVSNAGAHLGYSRLAGALTLVILNLPLLLRVTVDALNNVPRELVEASAALGARKVQTITRVMVPAALLPITTGVILTAGKMIGETAALIFTTGLTSAVTNWFSLDPTLPGATLTVHLYALQSEGVAQNAAQQINGTSALLILLLLTFNLGLRWLANLVYNHISGRKA